MTDSVLVDLAATMPSIDNSLIVKPGARVRMGCASDGFPAPDITFEKDGSVLAVGGRTQIANRDSGGQQVIIFDIKPTDEGRYRCLAANRAGFDSSFVDVAVQGIVWHRNIAYCPQFVCLFLLIIEGARIVRQMGAIFGNQKSVRVQRGEQFQMTCNATGGSDLTVQWLRYGQIVGNTGRVRQGNGVLRFDRVEGDDSGGYTCVARDGAGQDEDSIELTLGGGTGLEDTS